MRVALIQFNAGNDKAKNCARAYRLVEKALKAKAEFVLLPEVFVYRGPLKGNDQAIVESVPGPSTKPLAALALKYNAFILAGSVYERAPGSRKAYNTSVLINDRGRVSGKYRKINMFDAVIGAKTVKETRTFIPGTRTAVAKVEEFNIGMTVCYDLRFSDLYRKCALKGANVLCVPSAFTQKTGQAHWEVLLRARAVENLSYVLAPNQIGTDHRGIAYYGNSMVVDPWGKVIARASGNKEQIIFATIEKKAIMEARKKLPGIIN